MECDHCYYDLVPSEAVECDECGALLHDTCLLEHARTCGGIGDLEDER